MNKRKVLMAATSLSMVAILAVGGTLAYFTDADKEKNVFTVGNVDIDLEENFTQKSELVPTTGKNEDGTIKNAVKKEVFVENEGSKEAYVRVHIAIPAVLDNGDPTFDAGKNVLHFNYARNSVGEGLWDWSTTTGAPYEGDYNFYTTLINEVDYNVYVVTYEDAVAAGAKTVNAMHQVYLDSKVTNADITSINATLKNDWAMYVVAEGCQTDGFTDAYDALDTAFGVPGTYTPAWN